MDILSLSFEVSKSQRSELFLILFEIDNVWKSWKTLKILKAVLKLYKIKCLENLSFDVFKSQVDIYKFLRIELLSMLMK